MSELTSLQSRVYQFIRGQIEDQGCPPTAWEISQYFGWRSQNAAMTHIEALVKKGLLTKIPHTSRGLRLVKLPVLTSAEPANVELDTAAMASTLWQ
jgi:repressor LexA